MKNKASALIIRDKKLLVVTGRDADFYWTPGGTIEEGETPETAVHREIKEELDCEITNVKFYKVLDISKFETVKHYDNVYYFFADVEGEIKPSNEVNQVFWYGQDNFLQKHPRVSEPMEAILIPELISAGLL